MTGWHSRTRARGERRARAQARAQARARDSCATNHGTRCGSMAGGKSMPTVAAKIQHQFLATHTLLTCPTSLLKKPRVQRKFAKRAYTHAHANKRAHAVARQLDPLFPSRTHARVRARTHARALAHTCTRHSPTRTCSNMKLCRSLPSALCASVGPMSVLSGYDIGSTSAVAPAAGSRAPRRRAAGIFAHEPEPVL